MNTSTEVYHYAIEKSKNIDVIKILKAHKTDLNNSPVCDSAISSHAVKVEIPVKIVPHPPDLPHDVLVFAAGGGRTEAGSGALAPEIVDGHVAVVEADNDHVRVTGVDVE